MPKLTIHIHHYHGQTSIYDYEGWAHPRPDSWSEHEFSGSLDDARRWASERGGHGWKHFAVDAKGRRHEINRR
jgi:hypothetical protein